MSGQLKKIRDYPLVSVGVPVYNEGKYVAATLQSIADQDYPAMEVIISDNGSTDGTWDIIQQFVDRDHRFKAVRQRENRGATYNFNYVLEQARGEFFIWAGGHDLWGPGMISACVEAMKNHPSAALCVPKVKWMYDQENVIMEFDPPDTRRAASPAGRVLSFFEQGRRSFCIYGLHRRQTLCDTLPWPKTFGPDHFALIRIASRGDIIPANSVWHGFRKVRDSESHLKKVTRYKNVLELSRLSRRYPAISSSVLIIGELLKVKGEFITRVKLILFSIKKYFLVDKRLLIFANEILPVYEYWKKR